MNEYRIIETFNFKSIFINRLSDVFLDVNAFYFSKKKYFSSATHHIHRLKWKEKKSFKLNCMPYRFDVIINSRLAQSNYIPLDTLEYTLNMHAQHKLCDYFSYGLIKKEKDEIERQK